MLPVGNINSVILRWSCWSTKRIPDDSHLSNDSKNWTGGDKLRLGDDYVLSKNIAIWATALLFAEACMKCGS
jgi:hypothetical protein